MGKEIGKLVKIRSELTSDPKTNSYEERKNGNTVSSGFLLPFSAQAGFCSTQQRIPPTLDHLLPSLLSLSLYHIFLDKIFGWKEGWPSVSVGIHSWTPHKYWYPQIAKSTEGPSQDLWMRPNMLLVGSSRPKEACMAFPQLKNPLRGSSGLSRR